MAIHFANLIYRGTKAGVVSWDTQRRFATFEYTPEFIQNGAELAPLKMPLRAGPFQFPNLHESFSGLPGMLADCLPDSFGNALIDDWLRQQNRSPADFSPVERLCYIGNRGMGALEFEPAMRDKSSKAEKVEIGKLVDLASKALARKEGLATRLNDENELNEILRVGTSAGGARAKAVIAWNPQTNEVLSGQAAVPPGFEHWILKFDGISSAFDGVRNPQGYGRIEFAYYKMAIEAGITMSNSRLHLEGNRAHFMTRRFDRSAGGDKIHYASLFGIAHMPYAAPGTHSLAYEDYFDVIEQLDLPPQSKLEGFRRMVFNVLGCNRDDHTKNFGFLLNEKGDWELAPAFDVSYAHNPEPGKWTASQQMSIAGKRNEITQQDLVAIGRNCNVATVPKLKSAIATVVDALQRWEQFASDAGVDKNISGKIKTAITAQLNVSF